MSKRKQLGWVDDGDLFYSQLEFAVVKEITKREVYGATRKFLLSILIDQAKQLLADDVKMSNAKLCLYAEIMWGFIGEVVKITGWTVDETLVLLGKFGFLRPASMQLLAQQAD